jgi:phosphoglycerate dehydrogenase-like enzyme
MPKRRINAVVCLLTSVAAPALAWQSALRLPPAESIGSTTNARAADPARGVGADGKPLPLVYLASSLSDDEKAALAAAAPGVELIDGLNRQTALEYAPRAHGADAHLLTPEFIANAPNLVWAQSHSAGVERYIAIDELVRNDRIVLTNMRAAHGPAIADHSFAMLLTLTRNLRAYEDAQDDRQWRRDVPGPDAIALQDRTMLVVGLGGIGSEIAQRAHGFGMRVLATRRSDAPGPEWIERIGRPDELMAMLPEADVVAICVPLTPETQGMFDARAFEAMRPGSYLINIARGRVVNTDALLSALQSGRIAGACLDVTDPEPLPPDHPLWDEPNVIITPHVASDANLTDDRALALFVENMRRFDANEPLLNVVDKQAGY